MSHYDRLTMWRRLHPPLPVYPPPTNFQIRHHNKGDEATWLAIQRTADIYNEFSDTAFEDQYGIDEQLHHERVIYLATTAGEVIGTSTAWYGPEGPNGKMGRIHWVAILPDFQGQGLSKPLLAATLALLMGLGHRECFLTTIQRRVAAVSLYKQMGFVECDEISDPPSKNIP